MGVPKRIHTHTFKGKIYILYIYISGSLAGACQKIHQEAPATWRGYSAEVRGDGDWVLAPGCIPIYIHIYTYIYTYISIHIYIYINTYGSVRLIVVELRITINLRGDKKVQNMVSPHGRLESI